MGTKINQIDFLHKDQWKTGDSESKVRCKFGALFFGGQIIAGLGQWFAHTAQFGDDLLRPWRLKAFAEKLADREICEIKLNDPDQNPSQIGKICKHFFIELAKDIGRIVAFPFFLIARQAVSLYGMFDPMNGRSVYGKLDHSFSRMYRMDLEKKQKCIFWHYSAPCFQPYRTWVKENLYRYFHDYSAESSQIKLNRLYQELDLFSEWGMSLDSEIQLSPLFSNLHSALLGTTLLGSNRHDLITHLDSALEKAKSIHQSLLDGRKNDAEALLTDILGECEKIHELLSIANSTPTVPPDLVEGISVQSNYFSK